MTQSNTSPNCLMQQNERKASRTRSPSGRMFHGVARISSKEFASTRTLKSGTLLNACSMRQRVAAKLGRCAHSHIVRLMNNQVKGSKRMMTKVQWPCRRRMIVTKMYGNLLTTLTKVTKDRGDLIRGVIKSWDGDHLNVDHLMHDNWVAHFKT